MALKREISEVLDELLAGGIDREQALTRLISACIPLGHHDPAGHMGGFEQAPLAVPVEFGGGGELELDLEPIEVPPPAGESKLESPSPHPPMGEREVQNLGFARLDHDRARRVGFPEVVYAAGKTPERCAEIVAELAQRNPNVLCTRATQAHFEAVQGRVPQAEWDEQARVVYVWREREPRGRGLVHVVTAGTSDVAVAREAEICLRVMGNRVALIEDVGVAGLQRILAVADDLRKSEVIVCVAGMEGALPSVLAGLVACPVIAVPTSVGYGAAFGGVAALLGALSSCAAGVSVVNIDNGFGAAYSASAINRAGCRADS